MVRSASLPVSAYYWVVVADEYQAHFYTRASKSGLMVQQDTLKNEAARQKLEELISDRGGRSFDSQGSGRHAYDEEKSNRKTHSYTVFAREIADRVRAGQQGHKFVELAVIAAPRFLGVLRNALGKAGIEANMTIDKELTGKDAAFIQKLMDEHSK